MQLTLRCCTSSCKHSRADRRDEDSLPQEETPTCAEHIVRLNHFSFLTMMRYSDERAPVPEAGHSGSPRLAQDARFVVANIARFGGPMFECIILS
jgi:hypothetical protein